jgi:hypothetical protein
VGGQQAANLKFLTPANKVVSFRINQFF